MRLRGLVIPLFLNALLAACGGGGGGASSSTSPVPPTAQPLNVLFANFADNSIAVDPRTSITLTFDSNVSSDSLPAASVQLSDGANAVPLSITMANASVTFTPTTPLHLRTNYQLIVKSGVKSQGGGTLQADYALHFKTSVAVFEARTLVPFDPSLVGGFRPMIASADINGDGRPDIVQLGQLPSSTDFPPPQGYTLNIFLQNAQGGFDLSQKINFVIANSNYLELFAKVFLLDVDGDGVPEIVVPEYDTSPDANSGFRVFKLGSDGQFFQSSFIKSDLVQTVAALDVDGDGRIDLIGTESSNGSFGIFLNSASGLLPPQVLEVPSGAYEFAATDLNRDGSRQLIMNYVNGGSGPSGLSRAMYAFSADATGKFVPDTAVTQTLSGVCSDYQSCLAMAVIDINNDGYPDFVFGNVQPGILSAGYVRQPGAGFFRAFETAFGLGNAVLDVTDVDGDGVADLLIVDNPSGGAVAAALGQGQQTFEYSSAFALPAFVDVFPGDVSFVDLNGDGRPDVLVTGANTGISVMMQLKF